MLPPGKVDMTSSTPKATHEGRPTEKIRRWRHAGRGQRRGAFGSSSTTDWLLLWATGVGNANLAFLAGIGVALRSVRRALVRYFGR